MTPQDFIHKNVTAEPIKLGYDQNAAMTGADMAIDHYRRCSQASRKGKIFDDCLYIAKQWAGKQKSKPNPEHHQAPYRRSIPTLTMTAARRGTPLRECVGIINNDAYRDLPPDIADLRS